MDTQARRHVYGPVPSRRLGRSLGLDLVPFKVCSYDCVYCQLGRTTVKTIELKEYAPAEEILAELEDRLIRGPRPDFIGLAGSGEPTLHARIGDLIAGIKERTDIPVAVLTNGSMLWRPEVRAGLARADLVMPSLDAGDQETFALVNRPHPDISFERMVEGLLEFSHDFKGQVWLEVFVLGGITDRLEALDRIATLAGRLRPTRVQLNTVSRPPTEASALAVPADCLERLRGRFSGRCEVIAESRPTQPEGAAGGRDSVEEILALLSRRPCTLEGIATGLGLSPNEVLKLFEALGRQGSVRPERRENAMFYARVRAP